jgi:protein-S-isoprenylcysteine O-methyltransferase Ste14
MRRAGFSPHVLISIALWAIVSFYWEFAARGTTARRESGASRGMHLFLTGTAQLLIFLPVPGLRQRFMPFIPWVVVLGLLLEAIAVYVSIWARRSLGRNWSGAIAANENHELVRTGPYRFVRHPIYSGVFGLYLGGTLVSGEWHALVGLALAAIAYWRKIRMEERHLRKLFGVDYQDYERYTRRFIPRVF